MEDIRRSKYNNMLNRRVKINKFLLFLNNNWIKILILIITVFIIFFPEQFGNIVGDWFNRLVISFLEKLTF